MEFQWHDILAELWRTGLLYVLAFVVFRLMGKRSVSHMAPFDIAVVIIIGEAVAIGIEETTKSIFLPIVSIVTLGLLQFVLTWVNIKWRTLEQVSQGVATVLIDKGKIKHQNMQREHLSQSDLMISLREQGIDRIEDVETARLEPTGKVSVLPKTTALPVTAGEIGLPGGETLVHYLDRKFEEMRRGGG